MPDISAFRIPVDRNSPTPRHGYDYKQGSMVDRIKSLYASPPRDPGSTLDKTAHAHPVSVSTRSICSNESPTICRPLSAILGDCEWL